MAYALETTALVLGLQGNLSDAEHMLRTALRLLLQISDKHSSASTLEKLGEILRMRVCLGKQAKGTLTPCSSRAKSASMSVRLRADRFGRAAK
jgi:hypothetical protein